MKKTLLSISALMAAIPVMADVVTLTFDGEGDAYGIERQTITKPEDATFAEEITFSTDGIDFSLKKISETGEGFALVDAGGSNVGLLVYSGFAAATAVTPEITLKSPGGTISGATIYMSGTSLPSLDLECNGTISEAVTENGMSYWTWTLKDPSESIAITWNNVYFSRYIHSIELTYTPDLGGKEACGLSFSSTELEAYLGETVTSPTLSNPNNLPVIWSSSDPGVATVDEKGGLSLISPGTTFITAATEGNDEYAPGNARYTLTVVPSALNITQMLEFAPEIYNKVKVNCPLTVNFAYGSLAYVTDSKGNAACVDNIKNQSSTSTTFTTIYSVGDVIPAGWVATNMNINGSVSWQGIPGNVKETVDVEYPLVSSVTPADADHVVILKSVTFEKSTPMGFTKAYGTTPDGTTYDFQDTYNVTPEPAGTYNVSCVVKYSKTGSTEYFFLSPIAYGPASLTAVEPTTDSASKVRFFNLNGIEISKPDKGIYIMKAEGKTSKVIL